MKRKMSRGRFLAFALPLASLMALVVGGGGSVLAARYSIGIDPQQSRCLGYRVFFIDKTDKKPERGAIFTFRARGTEPYFPNDTLLTKMIDGLPGDRVQVGHDGVSVNGVKVPTADGLYLAATLNKPESRYTRDEYLDSGKYWFSGRTKDSFDSRYWGVVDESQVVGRAYPLW